MPKAPLQSKNVMKKNENTKKEEEGGRRTGKGDNRGTPTEERKC